MRFKEWEQLAKKGVSEAQSNLGLMYQKGQGVEQNYIEAHKWFNIAGMNGNKIGEKNTAVIEKKMLVGQIAIAVGLARKWKK